ncbi:hypothetical protein EPUS_05867 [Endocarpon pusillum Z07020]|uniref:Telomere-associated protein Rif1 N-terminal domain-containing protein n=1 Tax=Endocarpon pusillum (strain Z07020 / HMAS-L-300199) TaxID=1263415 RepID=U1I3I7_ENDPU|nr:uncharacterized protein EPUS_05867 [Endocarpon pusillum Z07020]ERF76594.1 hypothetical protein EPUS_05867 [Endocarpon pusillum Z07020]
MTSVEVLIPKAVNHPPRSASASTTKLSTCLPESLPSPPESSARSEQQQRNADTYPVTNAPPTDTPNPSPASCTASLEAGSGKLRKRVDFSPWTVSTDITAPESSVKSLPPSRECQSSKSILKQRPCPTAIQDEVPHRNEDLATMLDTILRQLANADRQIRLDAYTTLLSALKAYAELPDSHVTKEKVQALLDFIKRDVSLESGIPMEPLETNLILQALKLLVTIVWTRTLSVHLTDTYRSFIIDHSTRILEERQVSKALILHHMHLLSTQDFSNRTMTGARVVRLLEVLKDLPEHVRGNGVISERLMIYQRMLEQVKRTFKAKSSCWVSQLLSAMTCSVPDTRKKAIALAQRVAVVLGSSSTVATAVRDTLDNPGEHDDVLSSVICKRLVRMLKSLDEARQVPQIWAAVIVLMRGLDHKFHEWRHLHDWLRIIQKCFNCSDSEVRIAANMAWNKLVYVARPYGVTKSFLANMLMKPLLAQLERPSNEKQSKTTRNSAFAAYCNLLYYSLKPSEPFGHYDAVWDEFVVPALRAPFLSNGQNSDRACRILMALFWREKISPWREARVLDAAVIEPEELPLLDCKWIRSRTRSILEIFELLFRSSYWGPAAYPDTAYIAAAWRNFAKALGDACRKEVRSSSETMEAVTHVSMFLTRLCQRSSATFKEHEDDYVSRYHFICKTMLLEFGALAFVEVNLLSAPDSSSLPHNEKSKGKGRPLMIDILEATRNLPSSGQDDVYLNMVFDLLQLTSKSRSSANGRVHFYKECAEAVLLAGSVATGERVIWNAIAQLTRSELANASLDCLGDIVDVDHLVTNAVRILEFGVPYQSGQPECWSELLRQSLLVTDGSHQSGLQVTDRLIIFLGDRDSNEVSLCTAILVREFLDVLTSPASINVHKPNAKRAKREEGDVQSVYRSLVRLLNVHLSRVYLLGDCCDELVLASVTDAVMSLLQRSSTEYRLACLTEMQESLALWLEDQRRLMTTASRTGSLKLVQARKLCPVIIDVLGRLSNEIDLKLFDGLFAAAFRTTHRMTINQVVKVWNSNYGPNESLEYGDRLKEALARLIPFVELELPSLHDFESNETTLPELEYLENLDEEGSTSNVVDSSKTAKLVQPVVVPAATRTVHQKHRLDSGKTSTPLEAGVRARLHHDDSQVHFVSIESSPAPGRDAESQNLTARQKEIRERQGGEIALMFPDLRSSPSCAVQAAKTAESSKLVLASIEDEVACIGDPATPTLPLRKILDYEEAVQSSPTPKSKQQALRFEEIDAPSSPLSMHGPDDTMDPPEATIQLGCPDEVQDVTKEKRTGGVGLFDDIPVQPSSIGNEMEDVLPTNVEDLDAASLSVKPFQDHKHLVQIFSGDLHEQTADFAEDIQEAGPQVRSDLTSGEVVMLCSVTDVIPSDEDIIGKDAKRTCDQGPEGANSLLKVEQDTITDIIVAGIRPPTDRSNERRADIIHETAINLCSPTEESTKVYSDDNDFWSASQLSQDLERAASSVPSQSPEQQPRFATSAPAKRMRSPVAPPKSKRRKTTGGLVERSSTRRLPSSTTESQPSQAAYDCIEVETPSSSQSSIRAASAASQGPVLSQPALQPLSQPVKRGRGRPRKVQPQATMPAPAEARESLSENMKNGSHERDSPAKACTSPESSDQHGAPQIRPRSGSSWSHRSDNVDHALSSGAASNQNSPPQRRIMEVKTDDKENQVSPEEAVELLQKALSSLRRTSMDRSGLRAIDDLVFEIRTEAQNAAQRIPRSGT